MKHPIPDHMKPGFERYLTHGVRPGGFLARLLSGNIVGAWAVADPLNRQQFHAWLDTLLDLPSDTWGTPDRFEAWISQGGYSAYVTEPKTELFQ